MIISKGIYNMEKEKRIKHSEDWEKFRNSLEIPDADIIEIKLRVELMGKLLEIRKELGLTQAEFAKKCKIKQEYLARIEKSKSAPQIDTLLKILVPLGYKLDIVPLH